MLERANVKSLVLLAGLGLVLLAAWHFRPGQQSQSQSGGSPEPGSHPAGTAMARPQPLRVVKTNVVETIRFRWDQVESDDYRAYIARLRAIGCPEQTIRDLVIADIDKLFAARIHELNPAARELKFWQTEDKDLETSGDYQARQRQQREIEFAKRQIVQDLLGVDLVAERNKVQGAEDRFGRRLGFLPDEKRNQVRMLLEHYNGEELSIRQKTWEEGEALTDEEKGQLQALQKQRDEAIGKALSPQELEQYQMAMSPLAYKVRDAMFGMNPTEQEYVALYGLQKEFQNKWGDEPPGPENPQKQAEWEQARAELQAGLKEQLGEARYQDYVRAQDADFRELSVATARYKIPANVAAEVYEYKRIVLEQRARVAGNRSLSQAQQQAALEAMAAETEQTVRAALGDKAYNYYLRAGQGRWITGAQE